MPAFRTPTLLALLLAASPGCKPEPGPAAAPQPTVVDTAPPAASTWTRPALRPVADCEGCEAAWERDPATLGPTLRLTPPDEPGEPLVVEGTVYQADGRTPAAGVVLYFHQTNADGLYAGGTDESEWSRRHGRLRGWLRTGADGRYRLETIKPGQYPSRIDPAHIHVTVLEPGADPYWIDDIVFTGEPGVDATYTAKRENRGGSGVVTLKKTADGRLAATRDITLRRGS